MYHGTGRIANAVDDSVPKSFAKSFIDTSCRGVATGGPGGPSNFKFRTKQGPSISFKHQGYCFLDRYYCSEIIWTRNFTTFTMYTIILVQFTVAYHFS